MIGLKVLTVLVGVMFVYFKVDRDFILEAEFPFVGFGRVVFPEATVGDGEGGVGLAFGIDAIGEVAGGEVRPVVVFFALGGAEFTPPGFGLFPALGFEQGPEGGAVDHDAVVEVHDEAGGGFGFRVFGMGDRWALVGALADEGDEGLEFVAELQEGVVAIVGLVLGFAVGFEVGFVAGVEQVGEFAFELGDVGDEVVGEEGSEGVVGPAVDADVGDEVEFGGAEGEVDGALVVAFEVGVFEEVGAEPVAESFGFGDFAAVGGPGGVDGCGGGVVEAVVVRVVGGEVENWELGIENWELRILFFFYILTSHFYILKPSQGNPNAVREPIFWGGGFVSGVPDG